MNATVVQGSFFAAPAIELEERRDGATLLRSREPLGAYANDVASELERWARVTPNRPFLAERRDGAWKLFTYGETLAAVRAVGSAWLSLGLGATTPIAILSEPSIRHAIASLAAMYAGVPVAPISPAYSTQFGDLRRLQFILDALEPRLVFVESALAYRSALEIVPRSATVVAGAGAEGSGMLSFDELSQGSISASVDRAHAGVKPDDVAKILFTSGSTGEPKGVINTHRMLCSNQQSLAQLWPFLRSHPPTIVDWLPWHHTYGGNHNFNLVLFNGGTLYIDDGRPIPTRFADSVRNNAEVKPTLYFNVPRGHRLLVEALRADDAFAQSFFTNLDLISNAAAALPATTWSELRRLAAMWCGREVAIVGAWGSTETSPMATAVHYALNDPANIGLPGPGTELKLVPTEYKVEVRVRGPLVTPGYWRRPDLTEAAFDDEGFYRMGDAIRFADPKKPVEGLLFDGRIAENFKLSSGTWVDSGALRLALIAATAPLVDDAVIAGADREEIVALLFPNAAACRALCEDDNFARAEIVRLAIADALAAHNARAGGSSQHVAAALLVSEPLSPADGELTDKGSVNQRRVIERRSALVERLYALERDAEVITPSRNAR
jgi:feruloyl-CoA synthase